MCTSLLYRDANNNAYVGRTLELSLELPYVLARFAQGTTITSHTDAYGSHSWQMQHTVLAVTMPAVMPQPGAALAPSDLKIIEGINTAGLSCSMQSYPQAGGSQAALAGSAPVISSSDLAGFILGQFESVASLRAGLQQVQIELSRIAILGNIQMPFHFVVHDTSGASLVIEFHRGVLGVYDNPVGVMTNAPQFPWHLTNLDNYAFLSNVDHSHGHFGDYAVQQPGSGNAKAGLPGMDTSVDRFVRAAYYAHFAEKQGDADQAVQMVAHIMNNFDRPRGVTTDPPTSGSAHLEVAGQELRTVPTEFTSWTSISDLQRRRMYLRGAAGMSYVCLDLQAMAADAEFVAKPMAQLVPGMPASLSL